MWVCNFKHKDKTNMDNQNYINTIIVSKSEQWEDKSNNTAVYQPDKKISMKWNHNLGEKKITETWATNFPDKSGALISSLECFYGDTLIFSTKFAVVDGGRHYLPLPKREEDTLVASKELSALIKILDEIEGHQFYEVCLKDSGIKLIETSLLDS